MTAEERHRAAEVLRDRMHELGLSPAQLAKKAGVDVTTVRGILRADRDPSEDTRTKLARALEWPPGYGMRLINGAPPDLTQIPTRLLLEELAHRCGDG